MVEQGVHPGAVFRRDRVHLGNPQLVKLVCQVLPGRGIGFVDRQRDGFPQPLQHSGQVPVRGGDLRAPVHQENDVGSVPQHHLGLVEDLARDIFLVIDDDAAGVDHLETASVVLGKPVDPVARDARFVSDNGAPLSGNTIEEGGLSYVGPAHDDHAGRSLGHQSL